MEEEQRTNYRPNKSVFVQVYTTPKTKRDVVAHVTDAFHWQALRNCVSCSRPLPSLLHILPTVISFSTSTFYLNIR